MWNKLTSLASRLVAGITKKSKFLWVRDTSPLGTIYLPVVPVSLLLPKHNQWLTLNFLVDTGADFSLLPSSLAPQLGLDLSRLPQTNMEGVEGTGVCSWLATVEAKIAGHTWNMRVFLVDNDNLPFLLGRKDVFDSSWSLSLDPCRKQTVLTFHHST